MKRLLPRKKQSKQVKDLPKKVGVVDTNIGLDHAVSLAKKFEVDYFLASKSAFPVIFDEMTGFGFDRINLVDGYGAIEELDFIVFTDVFFGREADFLRKLGKKVFGAPYYWTRMENEKIFSYKETQKLGINVPKGTIVKGINEFLDFMEKNKKFPVFVKVNKYRGNIETTRVNSYGEAVVLCLNSDLGPFILDEEFLIQEECKGVELGFDILFNGKEFIKPFCFTIEVKGEGNLTKFVDKNALDTEIFDKIKDKLIEYNYRGNISLEFFYDGETITAIDWTCRLPFPCSSIQAKLIENWPDAIYAVANGESITLNPKHEYAVQIGLYTDETRKPRVIEFPEKYADNIGFRRVAKVSGKYYYICNDPLVATVVAYGDSPEEAIDKAYDIASSIEVSNVTFPSSFFKEEIEKTIKTLKEYGGSLDF